MSIDKQHLRDLPSVDRVLRAIPQLIDRWGQERVTVVVRAALEQLRGTLQAGACNKSELLQQVTGQVSARLEQDAQGSLLSVFNLTGTVLHTNLGRASLPDAALEAVVSAARHPSNLEYDLHTGKRGARDDHVAGLICELCDADAATVVNNNAAAVLLTLNTLADKAEVPVSRGELVEIGGSFRLPDIMRSSGCVLVEVGTTNRTHLKDYQGAINANTAMLLKVHTSNYRIHGFTHSVAATELAQLAHNHDLPVVIDLGSGNLVDLGGYGLPAEPTVKQTLDSGADLVTFSGDKLLGGPQCGIIAGKQELITSIKNNPLKRALRVDKMTLAALAEVLKLYRNPDRLAQQLPTLAALTRAPATIRAQAERLAPGLAQALAPRYTVTVSACQSQIGSGALPLETLPGYALEIRAADASDAAIRELAATLRRLPTPVIGRIHNSACYLDLRCLDREQDFITQLGHLRSLMAPPIPAQAGIS